MKDNLFAPQPPSTAPLALRPRDAAAALGISERLLLDWTQQFGLPCVRIGRVVLYPIDAVREWLWLRCEARVSVSNPDPDPAAWN